MSSIDALAPSYVACQLCLVAPLMDVLDHPRPCPSLSRSHIQPIPHIPQPRLQHPPLVHLPITAPHPNLHALRPRLRRPRQPLATPQNIHRQDPLHAPIPQRINRRTQRTPRSHDRIEDDGELGDGVAGVAGFVVGQVVVVLDGLERGLLAVHAQVVDGRGRGEEALQGGDEAEAGAEDGDQRDFGWREGGSGVGVVERGDVLRERKGT